MGTATTSWWADLPGWITTRGVRGPMRTKSRRTLHTHRIFHKPNAVEAGAVSFVPHHRPLQALLSHTTIPPQSRSRTKPPVEAFRIQPSTHTHTHMRSVLSSCLLRRRSLAGLQPRMPLLTASSALRDVLVLPCPCHLLTRRERLAALGLRRFPIPYRRESGVPSPSRRLPRHRRRYLCRCPDQLSTVTTAASGGAIAASIVMAASASSIYDLTQRDVVLVLLLCSGGGG